MIRKLKEYKVSITIGTLILALSAAVGATTYIHKTEDDIRDIAKKAIKQHTNTRLEAAHPGINKTYVSKEELGIVLIKIEQRLAKIEAMQMMILKQLSRHNISYMFQGGI